MDFHQPHDVEQELHERLSIGSMRSWLRVLAERQLPASLKAKVDASDIVQQAFVDAWKGHNSYRGTTQQEHLAWMRTILTRVILRNERDPTENKEARRRPGATTTSGHRIEPVSAWNNSQLGRSRALPRLRNWQRESLLLALGDRSTVR